MKNLLNTLMILGVISVLALLLLVPVYAAPDSGTGVEKIHVDLVGYLPDYPKVATIVAGKGAKEFKVVDAVTNKLIYKGKLSAPRLDISSGDTVRQADFSAITATGTYIVAVDGIGTSDPFKIENNVYNIPFIHTLRSFTLARCNTAVNDPVTGLSYAASHEKYKTAKVFFTDDVSTAGQILDVSGGWYDAGDFGKYIPTAGVTVANLLLAYEQHPEKFTKGQMFFPAGLSTVDPSTAMPDVLAEMKYELDWMLKMQRPDGGVYLKTSGKYWPDLKIRPEEDVQNRYIYGLSTYGTAIFGATNAMAARIYEPYDPAYAQILLDSAQKAFAFLESHPEPIFRMDANQDNGSGPYEKTKENGQRTWLSSVKKENPTLPMPADAEERIWIAAELFKTTGDKTYEAYLKATPAAILTVVPDAFSWMNTLALGQWAYITNPKADQALQAKTRKAFLQYADNTVKQIAADGYGCSLRNDEYTWASNRIAAAKGNMLLLAYQLQPRPEYVQGALEQIHYLLGRNTNGVSYVTGAGIRAPQHVHNRIAESTGIKVPGQLVGGPNNWPGGDPLQAKTVSNEKWPPAKVYFDVSASYSTNEYAIDYTAPVSYLLAYFSQPDDKLTAEALKLSVQNKTIR
ncbi:glycoside hydrolase family 9 protein [Propionispora hippei]|uniref:Endoglucanase n=1 Tax=Propionispora hippei DSM 15287 TaxID=1123003 RepID=A0A1M6DXJ0_9FIRM|nr:glycoside hydrolase family 9 protein [Propionispora hippei]SHI77931.1 endoglucanase [Propionispora hippei DSM 15287]